MSEKFEKQSLTVVSTFFVDLSKDRFRIYFLNLSVIM